jgi:hypothetical protein
VNLDDIEVTMDRELEDEKRFIYQRFAAGIESHCCVVVASQQHSIEDT